MTTLLLTLLLALDPAWANGKKDRRQEDLNRNMARSIDGRTLSGHRFVSSSMLEDPFVSPYVDSGTEWGYYQYNWYWDEHSPWPWDEGSKINLDMLTMAQSFRVSVGFWQRVLLYADMQGAVQVAYSQKTALYSAADAGLAGGGGLKVEIWDNDWFQVGASMHGSRSRMLTASPINGLLFTLATIEDYIEAGEIPETSDLTDQSFWNDVMFDDADFGQMGGGVQMAAGLHETTGVWMQLNMEYAESKIAGLVKRDAFYMPGLGLSFSTAPLLPRLPLGVVIAYMGILPAEPTSGYGEEFRAGLFYTGRDYVDVGIEIQDHKDVADVYADDGYWQDYAEEVRTRMTSVRTRVRVYF